MWDDDFNSFWHGGRQRKQPGKFLSGEAIDGAFILRLSSEFIDYLHEQNMSDSAIRVYPAEVAGFYEWLQDRYPYQLPRKLYREHVIEYRDDLVSRRVKPQSINHKLSALRKYNEYLMAYKYQRHEVFKRGDFLRLPPKVPQAFSIPESHICSFLKVVGKAGNVRDAALVTLLAHTGMTLQEALDLRTFDFDWSRAEVTVNAGDQKKERTLALDAQTVDALKAYREVRSTLYPKAGFYFFAAQGSSKLTYSTVNRLFQRYSKTITPQTLRQWYQVGLLNKGAIVAEVVYLTGADAQTVSGLVKCQADVIRQQSNAR